MNEPTKPPEIFCAQDEPGYEIWDVTFGDYTIVIDIEDGEVRTWRASPDGDELLGTVKLNRVKEIDYE